jgi:hypothetical protein
MECPYQTDDGKLAAALSLASRITLPLVTCVIVGFYFNSITTKESRAINQQEAIVGLGALFFAYQPTLMSEVLRFAANKYLK